MSLIDPAINLFYQFLIFTRDYLLEYNFPTNPVTAVIYLSIAYYGYLKIRQRYTTGFKPIIDKLTIFIYSVCILAFLNFNLENVWLTCFYIRFHYFNPGGSWMPSLYSPEPYIWISNYGRNICYIIVCYILVDPFTHKVWKLTRFTWKTYVAFGLVSLYIVGFFFLLPTYAATDWSYALAYGYDKSLVVSAFLIGLYGKPLLFYLFYTIWRK